MSHSRSVALSKYFGLTSEHAIAQAFWIVTFALLTAIGAQVEIPHKPVPYTFQTLFVLLSGSLLGKRNGFLSMIVYLGLGVVGVPVFSGAGFGFGRILGPTGGYLLAFPITASVVGSLVPLKGHVIWTMVSMAIGLLLLFTIGTFQLGVVSGMRWNEAVVSGFLIFSWWDLLKLVAAAAISWQFTGKHKQW